MNRPLHIVFGGTRGIGRAVAKLLAREGNQVVVVGRREPAPGSLDPAIQVVTGDFTEPAPLAEKLRRVIREHGKIRGMVFTQRFRGSSDPWQGEFQVTLSATKYLIEDLQDEFDGNGKGAIVVVGSNAAQFVAREQPLSYHVAKAGLVQLVRYFAATLGSKSIRVNAVSPCTILKEESRAFYLGNERLSELYRRITPLGRMGTAEEVAEAVAFLCGPRASFITGQELTVDGGLSLALHDSLARALLDGGNDERRSQG
jgi:NAD(P)-dependent dehydrogenase (short-subunit alcohol dehydrogenase family)